MRHLLQTLSVVALFSVLAGCGGSGSGPEIYTEQQIIAPSGGTYQWRGGQISITAQANAVTTNTPVTIQSPPSVAVPVDANVVRDTTFQFSPVTFATAVTVGLGFDPADLPSNVAESRLRVVRLSNGTWVSQTATLDANNDRMTFTATTLGVYAIRIN